MDWLVPAIALIAAYALIAWYIHKKSLFPDRIAFYGPFLAIKSEKVRFFDRFTRYSNIFRAYGTFGVVTVAFISVAMVFLLFVSLHYNIVERPPPTVINEVQSFFAIPGINPFIPFTLPVWFGIIVTLIIHEFGHGILCRVEGIRVKTIGLLFAVLPIGAFVEPDEEELDRKRGMPKMRMYGAGIANNLVIGLICFGLMFFLLGMAVPASVPLIKSVYKDYPADAAGIPPNSIIRSVNGIDVSTREEVSAILNRTNPGDQVTLGIGVDGKLTKYVVTAGRWPAALDGRPGAFIGVAYYDANAVKKVLDTLATPAGLIFLMGVPIALILDPVSWQHFMLLINDTVDATAWSVPFPQYWFAIQFLFWCGWFNIVVGTFNALPLVPLDGGYILKEGVERLFERRGWQKYASRVIAGVSSFILMMLVLIPFLPWLLRTQT
jgi:membrane-associated protease RseP (regulator of RpoE activity)